MSFVQLNRHWKITVKTKHDFELDVQENILVDVLKLYVDDVLVAKGTASYFNLKNYCLFNVDGRILELRWVWNWRTGNPLSILIMHKGRILAQYGSDRAAKDDFFDME